MLLWGLGATFFKRDSQWNHNQPIMSLLAKANAKLRPSEDVRIASTMLAVATAAFQLIDDFAPERRNNIHLAFGSDEGYQTITDSTYFGFNSTPKRGHSFNYLYVVAKESLLQLDSFHETFKITYSVIADYFKKTYGANNL